MKTKLILLLFVFASCKGTKISRLKECQVAEEVTDQPYKSHEDFLESFSRKKIVDQHVCFKLISHVNIVDVANGDILTDQNVLLADDTIAEISNGKRLKIKIPKGTCILKIDGAGKYLAPGLCDMHSHYCGEMRLDYLVNGITTVRVNGPSAVHFTEQSLVNTYLLGPEVFCTTPIVQSIHELDSITKTLDSAQLSYNWMYLNNYVPSENMEDYLRYASDRKLVSSLDFRVDLPKLDYPAGTVFEQMIDFNFIKNQPNLSSFWFVSKFAHEDNLKRLDYLPIVSEEDRDAFVKYLRSHPSQFTMGTEAGLVGSFKVFPGSMFFNELNQLYKNGIRNADIVRMATMNAYALIDSGKHDEQTPFGQVKRGYRANLVLLNKNPLDDVTNYFSISAVFIAGHYLDISDISRLRKEVAQFNPLYVK